MLHRISDELETAIVQFVDLKRQYEAYRAEIDARIQAVLDHTRFIMGPEIEELERKLAARVGVAHAITTGSGTVSLEIALRALGIGPGDEVVTTPFTWISSAEVVRLVGATPVFVDVDEASLNVDPDAVERALGPRTRAVIAVNLFGQMADYERILEAVRDRGVAVIEDAAQSFGASRNGRASCAVTGIGSTSFFPAKTLGCFGDGGALFVDDDDLAGRMRAIRTHGGRRHEHRHVGTNGRFDTLQAAVLLAKLPHFDEELRTRQRLAARYADALGEACLVPGVCSGNTHVFSYYTVRVARRDRVRDLMRARGVPTSIYYPRCLHEQPAFADLGYAPGDFPIAERASREVLSLPMHPFLTDAEQNLVVKALRSAVEEAGRGSG